MDPYIDIVSEALAQQLRVPRDTISAESTLDDLGLDSLAAVELFVTLQETRGATLDESLAVPALTVAETAHMLAQALQEPSAGPPA